MMSQIRLSHPFPQPNPSPPPQQQRSTKRIRQLFPPNNDEPQEFPQLVAAKSLMLKPPKFSLQCIIFDDGKDVNPNVKKFRKKIFFHFSAVCGIIR